MSLPSVVIVSPAGPAANNGNWRTAQRWQALLAPAVRARVVQRWPDAEASGDEVMLALHARRSADAVGAWAARHGGRGLAVVLTGTDLYHDLAVDAQAREAIALAQRLVVLQECGPDALPPAARGRTRVIFQSAPARPPQPRPEGLLQAVMAGHLRPVKSPETLFAAMRLLAGDEGIRVAHIGDAAAEPQLAQAARATARDCPHYQWLGGLPHDQALAHIARAHLLVHTSAMEGGAHVILEAVSAGTPVLASRVPGNVGMLGPDYAGYFPHGDAAALAALLRACRADQVARGCGTGLWGRLAAQCHARAPLFAPAREREALLQLVRELREPLPWPVAATRGHAGPGRSAAP